MGRSGSSLTRGPPVGLGPIREPWPSAGGYKYPLSLEGQVFYSHSQPHSLIATDLSIGEPCRYPPHLALQARYCALTILLIRYDQFLRQGLVLSRLENRSLRKFIINSSEFEKL